MQNLTNLLRFSDRIRNQPIIRSFSAVRRHQGIKVREGEFVRKGRILATQGRLNWHPGLNVGFGRTGELYAIIPGYVVSTWERVNLNWDHTWITANYGDRTVRSFYKMYLNVVPELEHRNFRLISRV